MADTYYFNQATVEKQQTVSSSPYLLDRDISSPKQPQPHFIRREPLQPVPQIPALYDEETHAFLNSEPLIDIMMQSKPLTWSFSGSMFNPPERFLNNSLNYDSAVEIESRMDGFAVTKHRYDANGLLSDEYVRSNSPFDSTSASLAAQLRKLHSDGIRLCNNCSPIIFETQLPSPTNSCEFDSPWWPTSDSIYEGVIDDSKFPTLSVYRKSVSITSKGGASEISDLIQINDVVPSPTGSVGVQATPSVVPMGVDPIDSPMRNEMSTQYETCAVPRILIDAVTGTDEMERDLRKAAVGDFVDQLILDVSTSSLADVVQSQTVSPVLSIDVSLAETPPDKLSAPIDPSKDKENPQACYLKSPEREEYDFVNVAEVAE